MTPEEIEELGKAALHPYIADLDEPKLKAFIAGHHSRDEEVAELTKFKERLPDGIYSSWKKVHDLEKEVERLVEALREIAYSDEVSHIDSAESVAKEALKQYQI